MSACIHHPNCNNQEEIHDVCLGDNPTGSGSIFEGWPKVLSPEPVAQEAPSAAVPPKAVPAQPAPSPAATLPDAVTPGDAYGEPTGVTTTTQWKNNVRPIELSLPSGNVCLVKKRGGMGMFLKNGQVPNTLMPIVQRHMNDGLEVDMAKVGKDVQENPELLNEILTMANNVVLESVMQPPVFPIPTFTDRDEKQGGIPTGMNVGDVVPQHMRDQEMLFIDEVDMEDKMFIFQWACGGSSDLERFRRESGQAMADLPTVEGVGAAPVADSSD